MAEQQVHMDTAKLRRFLEYAINEADSDAALEPEMVDAIAESCVEAVRQFLGIPAQSDDDRPDGGSV